MMAFEDKVQVVATQMFKKETSSLSLSSSSTSSFSATVASQMIQV